MTLPRLLLAVTVALVLTAPPAAHAADRIGVVLMHGKNSPAPPSLLGRLVGSLQQAGFLVVAPEMPWSRARMLAKDYEACMAEIDEAVEALKAKGATRIVVGGQSMGSNAALGYAARRDGLAGVIVIAPGHVPDLSGFQNLVGHDYKRAKEMVAAGHGGETGRFNDVNQGKGSIIATEAAVYLSWFDPEGPAVFPRNAANLKPGTPLLWIVGDRDRMARRGEDYAFAKAPANPKNAYVVINSNHINAPTDGATKIIDWLKKL